MDKNFITEAVAREMGSGVLALNSNSTILYANPFFLRNFPLREAAGGAAGGEITGRRLEEVIGNTELKKTVCGLTISRSTRPKEIEVVENGRYYSVRFVPLKEDGDFCLLLFLHDITEEKRVETIKKDFVANVSHELRTPLASIKGYAETLLDGGLEEAETGKDFLRVIDRHATRMSRIIDDLLVLSKLESHSMPMTSSPVDLGDLLISTKKSLKKQASDKGINLSADVPADLPKVIGDRDRLEQVVVNLLDNAIKYTPAGGSVHLSAERENGWVRVDVTDTGIGIPPEDIPRIFERFYRVDKARSRDLGGTGLGLAIVKHIVQGLGGSLNVKSTPGKGSTFSFTMKSSA